MVDMVGQQLGHYRLTRLLGEGAFAHVYLGEHVHLGTQAAIKVLHTRLTNDDVELFRSEARTIAHLKHRHIVPILDFGVENEIPFLVMEYATNGSLRQHFPQNLPLTTTTILPYVKQIASALQHAHYQSTVHRDVKPENMLLGNNHEILLSDFGLAVITQGSQVSNISLQRAPGTAGTIFYMAPEQLQGQPCPASDQYALGVVIYEWLSGARPFNSTHELGIAVQHITTQPLSLRARVPAISPAVEHVVLTTLAKDPDQRFKNMQAFLTAFELATKEETTRSFQGAALPESVTGEPQLGGSTIAIPESSMPSSQWGGATIAASWSQIILPTPPLTEAASQAPQAPQTPQAPQPSSVPFPRTSSIFSAPITPVPTENAAFVSQQASVRSQATRRARFQQWMMSGKGKLWLLAGCMLTLLAIGIGILTYNLYTAALPTATETLDTFCGAIQGGDMQTAYNQFTSDYQNTLSETLFANNVAHVSRCVHSESQENSASVTADLTLTHDNGQTAVYTASLLKANDGTWKIYDFVSPPNKVLDTFCAALQSNPKDYQTAFNLFSESSHVLSPAAKFQNDFSSFVSCVHTFPLASGVVEVANVTLHDATGQAYNFIAVLVKDGNGWKIDRLSRI